MSRGEPGPWGDTVAAGRSARVLRRVAVLLGVGGLLAAAAVGTTAQLLVEQAEANLTRVAVPELEEPPVRSEARYFLVVGSDARDGLDAAQRRALTLGSFDGERSDVIIYLAISEDRDQVSLVSFPRDLLVRDAAGRDRKLTDTFDGDPDELIRILRQNFALPVNHFAEVTIAGFVDVVETLGSVEICLDDPLRDRRSGADFTAGCHDMDGVDALAYVRSRQGARADLERIDRQQSFLRAVLRDLTATRTLANPRQVYRLTEDVAGSLIVDDSLGTTQMLGLADELRTVVAAGMPMTAVPAYPRRIDGLDFMVAYGPGADALFRDLRNGRPLADRGSRDDRDETVVAIAAAGQPGAAGVVDSTLRFSGFRTRVGASAGATGDLGGVTTVLVRPGEEDRAGWVAATLGAPTRPVPEELTLPDGVHVLVVAGVDALS